LSQLHFRRLVDREVCEKSQAQLLAAGLDPVLARCLASRQVTDVESLDTSLGRLPPPRLMKRLSTAAEAIGLAIGQGQRLLIAGDYDADGATATALLVQGLGRLGGTVDFVVPDRFRLGYGLTPGLIDQWMDQRPDRRPDWIITVDNGISALEGVAHAQSLGVKVLVTDHHLPGTQLPDCLILNPQLGDETFPSKHLAGVGVAFYLVMAVRTWMAQQSPTPREMPRIDDLLALVALGTVADLVRLDDLNRRLVSQGLGRLQRGSCSPGLTALFQVAGRAVEQASVEDLGFLIGPRLNAAGRLTDMTVGIQCLLANSLEEALPLAHQLQALNLSRREQEASSRAQAIALVEQMPDPSQRSGLVLFDPRWNIGLVGLIASRLKDQFYRPTIVFGQAEEGLLRGSGRSIPGIHLRDVLERIHTQQPGLLMTFGGHAMAAGLSLASQNLSAFEEAFEQTVRDFADEPSLFDNVLLTDGELEPHHHQLRTVEQLNQVIWGQGFPRPVFRNRFRLVSSQRLKEKHLRLGLQPLQSPAHRLTAIWFDAPASLEQELELAYELQINEWQGQRSLQLLVRAAQALPKPDKITGSPNEVS